MLHCKHKKILIFYFYTLRIKWKVMVFQIRGRAKLFVFIEITEQELKKKILTRTGRLIIRYAPSAKAQDAQWAYVGQYLFSRFVRNSVLATLCDPFIELQAKRT